MKNFKKVYTGLCLSVSFIYSIDNRSAIQMVTQKLSSIKDQVEYVFVDERQAKEDARLLAVDIHALSQRKQNDGMLLCESGYNAIIAQHKVGIREALNVDPKPTKFYELLVEIAQKYKYACPQKRATAFTHEEIRDLGRILCDKPAPLPEPLRMFVRDVNTILASDISLDTYRAWKSGAKEMSLTQQEAASVEELLSEYNRLFQEIACDFVQVD